MTETTYFRVLNEKSGSKYMLSQSTTGIDAVSATPDSQQHRVYSIDGRYVGTDLRQLGHGLYIVNGKKVVQ